jgi:NADH dehydrogenase
MGTGERSMKTDAVTGAFGYSGKYITQRLLGQGRNVITLTNSVHRANPFGERVKAFPFNFDKPVELARSLENVATLYNTYWVRFNHATFSHADAVRNTITLFTAAKTAGVRRVVHVSITNPTEDSPREYFSGKARLERALIESNLSYAILRPTVLFGKEDILVNNIAWALRQFPVFGVFGDGQYRLQPIYVDDLAALAVREGLGTENKIINAIGPETFTYRGLVEVIGRIIGKPRPVLPLPPVLGYAVSKLLGWFLRDEFITMEEIKGLMANLLVVDAPPAGPTKLTEWAAQHREELGRRYASELARRRDRQTAYVANET